MKFRHPLGSQVFLALLRSLALALTGTALVLTSNACETGDCTPGTEGCACAMGASVVPCTSGFVCGAENLCVADPNAGAQPGATEGPAPTVTGMVLSSDGMPTTSPDDSAPPMGSAGGAIEPDPMNTAGAMGEPALGGAGGMHSPPAGGEPGMSNGGAPTGGGSAGDGQGGMPSEPNGGSNPMPEPESDATVVANPCDGSGTDDCDSGCSAAENNGSVYMLCDGSAAKAWEQAAEHCAMHDMRLARLDSLAEYEWLGSLVYPQDHPNWVVGDLGTRVWIGLSNPGDDTFAWEDGSPLDFVIWGPGEPSYMFEGADENCVHYWNHPPDLYDILNDSDCGMQLPYACRRY